MRRIVLLAFFCILTIVSAVAQVISSVSYKRVNDKQIDVIFTLKADAGWHVYGTKAVPDGPTNATFNIDSAMGVKLKGTLKGGPGLKTHYEEMFEAELSFYEGTATFTQSLELTDKNYDLKGYLQFGACNDSNCLPPMNVDCKVKGTDGPSYETAPDVIDDDINELQLAKVQNTEQTSDQTITEEGNLNVLNDSLTIDNEDDPYMPVSNDFNSEKSFMTILSILLGFGITAIMVYLAAKLLRLRKRNKGNSIQPIVGSPVQSCKQTHEEALMPKSNLLQGGKYCITQKLGHGGFGITYLGQQVSLGRVVAIKEFFIKGMCDREANTHNISVSNAENAGLIEQLRNKFMKEARNIAKLSHPNIVRVIDVFEERGTSYYVMEYIEGGSLAQKVKADGALSEAVATRYILQIAEAVRYIHQRKMNHLDIKPANIMINEQDSAVLIDFGLSKQYDTTTGNQTSSTPVGISEGYAPLEQYKRGGVQTFSPETDIYSLGATFYNLLTAQKPPSAADINEEGLPVSELQKHGVAYTTIQAIQKAMNPRRSDRFHDASEFIAAVQGIMPCKQADLNQQGEETIITGF